MVRLTVERWQRKTVRQSAAAPREGSTRTGQRSSSSSSTGEAATWVGQLVRAIHSLPYAKGRYRCHEDEHVFPLVCDLMEEPFGL